MASLFEVLASQLGGSAADTISRQLGTDQRQTKTAIAASIPSLIEALSRQAAKPGGADSLHNAIQQDHDGSLLDSLNDYLQQQRKTFQDGDPAQASVFGKMLDQDGDGDFDASDMMRLGTSIMGRMFK